MTAEILVIGGGPAGLLAAWVAAQRGARVRVLAAGIGTTHVMPGWIEVLDTESDLRDAVIGWIDEHPLHPYKITGVEGLEGGLAALSEVCGDAGIHYVTASQSTPLAGSAREGSVALSANFRLPTSLGAIKQAAVVPETFAAGDLRLPGDMLIASPAGWRDFYPELCAANLQQQGFPARGVAFDVPELQTGKFDATALGLARLFDDPEIRSKVAGQLRERLDGAQRVGLPAVIGIERSREAWQDLEDRLGVPIFEIPTLPPSVPGIRLYGALKGALQKRGVQILLDMPVARGLIQGRRVGAVAVPGPIRELIYRADQIILATGGLYGGGIQTDYGGGIRELVFGLPIQAPDSMGEWFDDTLLGQSGHLIHYAGVMANREMQPIDNDGGVVLENVRIAGRLLGGYSPLREGSTEGVLLASAYQAAVHATQEA